MVKKKSMWKKKRDRFSHHPRGPKQSVRKARESNFPTWNFSQAHVINAGKLLVKSVANSNPIWNSLRSTYNTMHLAKNLILQLPGIRETKASSDDSRVRKPPVSQLQQIAMANSNT